MKLVPPPPEVDSALWAGLARRLRLAWAVLLWERLWPLLLPPLCVAGLFVAFALFDIAPLLPVWLHGLVLAASAGGVSFLLVRGALRLNLPGMDAAARRLERDSGLDHRPLAALDDRPAASDDPVAHALWLAHLRRAAGRLGDLRLRLPHPNMAARDPWGLRAAVLLLLVIAMTGARDDAPRRLVRALSPEGAGTGLGPDAVEVWITPPVYTGLAPVLLKPGTVPAVSVPTGSAVLAVLSGGWGTAHLRIGGDDQPFQRQSDGSQRVEATLSRSARLSVRQSLFSVAAWDVQVAADAVPSAAFALPPEAGERGRLRLAVSASDDYGLAHVRVLARRLGISGDEPPLVVELPVGGQPRSAEIAGWFDLTAHPWAGLPVSLQPVAEDALGQTGAGEGVTITLPERRFSNPVAAAVVEGRRAITEDLANVPAAVDLLDRIAIEPELFNDDLKTFLLLRAARHALESESGFDLAETQELMWQAALRLEDGDLSSAERALDEARRALEQAVEAGASTAELNELLDRFQQALERYTQALAEQMARQGQSPPLPQADGRVIGEDELRQMVDNLRDMAEAGARDALRQMLAQMGQILDGLQAGAGQQAGGPAQDGLRQLRDLARKQQELLDDSHRRGMAGEAGEGDGAQAAQAQDALRRALAEATRKLGEGLGEAPAPLADADGAMAGATDQLHGNRWDEAAQAQAQALAALQRATREALEQMGNSGQGMPGMVARDPLGRPQRGPAIGDDGTRVPDRGELQRSRQLLDEIRRRAGEARRPEMERDYLKRLLKQF